MGKLNLRCYSLVPKNHRCIPYFQFEIFCRSCFKFLIWNFTVVLIRFFFLRLRTRFFKTIWPTQIFFRKLLKFMEKEKSLSNKVSSPEEFFQLSQNLLRKQKTNHRLFKPSSIFWFHNPLPCQVYWQQASWSKCIIKFNCQVTSRKHMVRGICDFVVRYVTPNHKPRFSFVIWLYVTTWLTGYVTLSIKSPY